MAYVTVTFNFRESNTNEECSQEHEFDACEGLEREIDDWAREWIDENNDQELEPGSDADAGDDEAFSCWVLTGWEYSEWDDDFNAPTEFKSADEYGAYVELCEKHGEGYRLRYDDIGDNNFEDEYNGCWASEEDFARQLYEDCYDIPDHLAAYIDWEHLTRDVLADYSVYSGNEGYHIFRD